MKQSDTLTMIFEHHLWANLRLVVRCTDLTPDHLNATVIGAYGSIHEILQHIATSEQSYYSRISTGEAKRRPADAPPMTLDEIAGSLRESGAGFVEWLSKVKPEDTVAVYWGDSPRDVPTTIILTQMIHHGTEHREQVKAILTNLGIEPPDLQAWQYFDEMDRRA